MPCAARILVQHPEGISMPQSGATIAENKSSIGKRASYQAVLAQNGSFIPPGIFIPEAFAISANWLLAWSQQVRTAQAKPSNARLTREASLLRKTGGEPCIHI